MNTTTLFTVVVREIGHAEKVIIDTLLLKGVGSPPWLIVLSLYWPCLRAPDNSPTRLTFSPNRGTDLTCPVRSQQQSHWSPNYSSCTCWAHPLSQLLNSSVFKMENKGHQYIKPSVLLLSEEKRKLSLQLLWILACCIAPSDQQRRQHAKNSARMAAHTATHVLPVWSCVNDESMWCSATSIWWQITQGWKKSPPCCNDIGGFFFLLFFNQ